MANQPMELKLHAWQDECLESWLSNGRTGILNVVTGAGKTALAVAAIERLLAETESLQVKIVVPKTFLVSQWINALREFLQIQRHEIGVISGSHKKLHDRKYMLYVINSARHSLARHILNDLLSSKPVFLIADECHHYGTAENSKIFDFYPWRFNGCPSANRHIRDLTAASTTPVYTLGLSATPYCENFKETLVPCLGPEIYHFSFFHAISAGIINRFAVFHISLRFTAGEQDVYDELTGKIGIALNTLSKRNPGMGARDSSPFFMKLRRLVYTGTADPISSDLAKAILLLMYQRKNVVYHASSRVRCVLELVRLIRSDAKIIIFGERIETADEIYRELNGVYPNETGIYHSGIHKSVGESALRKFKNGEIRILVSCKTLDEGLSVDNANVGIIVSSTNSSRQRTQRLGRILRKKENKPACFYYLYIEGTTEESDILRDHLGGLENEVPVMDLSYDCKANEFLNHHYDRLAESVVSRVLENGLSEAEQAELKRNLSKGILTCDWLLTEDECRDNITGAKNKSERNYYAAMLYMIRQGQNR
jgi:superfamily II DNA or RNA helicase